MGIILNPRGAGGSGKTELVRRIMEKYGWRREERAGGDAMERLYRPGRRRPFAYRFRHPFGARPLVVLGHYEATSGGCDTIRADEGGLAEVARSAATFAATGHDVIIEGLRLSQDTEHTLKLADEQPLRILRLRTPPQQCIRNLVTRRRARRNSFPTIERAVTSDYQNIQQACALLRPHANVEDVTFDEALARANSLLGLARH